MNDRDGWRDDVKGVEKGLKSGRREKVIPESLFSIFASSFLSYFFVLVLPFI